MEKQTLILRDCTKADLDQIREIYADAVLHGSASFEIDPPDLAEMSRRRAALVENGYPYLVAERAGAVVGYAYAGPYRTRPAYRATVENSIYIARDAQGSGIGRMLLSALIARCDVLGFRQMIAIIGDSANAPSIALHHAAGFKHAGLLRAVGFKHGRWLDSVIMQLDLGPGDRTPLEAPHEQP